MLKDRDVLRNQPDGVGGPEYLSAVLEALTAGVIATDHRFVVRWFNESAREIFPEVVTGRNLYEILEPFVHEQKIDRMLLRRERIVVQFEGDRPTTEWMRTRKRLANGDHVVLLWPAVLTDDLVDRRVDFAIGAFHEIRTPLTVLLGFAEMLESESDGLSEGQLEAVEVIHRTARQLADLSEDLLDLTRNSYGELRLHLEPVDLAPVVEAVIALHQSEAAGRCHRLDLRIEPDLPPVEADPGRIRQVIDNLVTNACLHNPDGTLVEVSLRQAGEGIEFEIRDHGEGIGFANPDDAFRTFNRAESAITRGRDGSGIGLPLAKRLIELHRGRLLLESPIDGGTRATVWLPLDRENAIEPGESGPA